MELSGRAKKAQHTRTDKDVCFCVKRSQQNAHLPTKSLITVTCENPRENDRKGLAMVKKTSVRFEKPTAEIDNFEAPEADTSGDLRYVSRETREGKVKNARTERIRK